MSHPVQFPKPANRQDATSGGNFSYAKQLRMLGVRVLHPLPCFSVSLSKFDRKILANLILFINFHRRNIFNSVQYDTI